jgi:hypothetical protein
MKSINEYVNENYDASVKKSIKLITDEIVDLEDANKIKELRELITDLLNSITNNGEDQTVLSVITKYVE